MEARQAPPLSANLHKAYGLPAAGAGADRSRKPPPRSGASARPPPPARQQPQQPARRATGGATGAAARAPAAKSATARPPAVKGQIDALARAVLPSELLQLHGLLEEGAHASVFRATHASLGEVAATVISKRGLSAREHAWIGDELRAHAQLRHPHIVRLHAALDSADSLTLVLELCRGGSLRALMDELTDAGRRLEARLAKRYFCELVGALHYCHRHGVVHRDVKLDNLCLRDAGGSGHLMLVDFGYAAQTNDLQGFVGSPHFAAPEVHAARAPGAGSYAGTPADVWSAGIVLFALLAHALPFGGDDDSDELRARVQAGAWGVEPACEGAARALLGRLLDVEPSRRITLDEVCEHEWIVARADADRRTADGRVAGEDADEGRDNCAIPWRGLDEMRDEDV
jgi:serine/threonine protein kinase